MGHITNKDVFGIVDRGGNVSGYGRNFYGFGDLKKSWVRVDSEYVPKKVARSLEDLAQKRGGFEAVLYSYATPIAVKIAGVWLAPDVSYSATTSTRHQSQLYGRTKWIPGDAGLDELESVLDGYMEYDRYGKRYHRGPVRREAGAEK